MISEKNTAKKIDDWMTDNLFERPPIPRDNQGRVRVVILDPASHLLFKNNLHV